MGIFLRLFVLKKCNDTKFTGTGKPPNYM